MSEKLEQFAKNHGLRFEVTPEIPQIISYQFRFVNPRTNYRWTYAISDDLFNEFIKNPECKERISNMILSEVPDELLI